MKTLHVSIYRFTELPEAAQERAVKLLSDIGLRTDWYAPIVQKYAAFGCSLEILGPCKSDLTFSCGGPTLAARILDAENRGTRLFSIAHRYHGYFDLIGGPDDANFAEFADLYDDAEQDFGEDLARAASVELTEARIRVTSPEHVRSLLEKSVRWFYSDGAPYLDPVL